MQPYIFQGIVLPERAQLSLEFSLGFEHLSSGIQATARVSIILNQVVVWIDTDQDWNVFDLRNVVANIVKGHLQMVGYLKGLAYDFELTRVINQDPATDYVFGIDIPCLVERGKNIDLNKALTKIREKIKGRNGIYLNRCLSDLSSAMKHADDTGFYCYRAIEALRHHCAAANSLVDASNAAQWQKFREVAGCEGETLMEIKAAADPLRHGQFVSSTSVDRKRLFTITWNIVDGYLFGV
jgi:hypothetical protein